MKSVLEINGGNRPKLYYKREEKVGFNAEINELIDTNPDIREYILSDSIIFEIVKKIRFSSY